MNAETDYYAILGIPVTSSFEEIKKSYHELVRKHHPDKTDCDLKPSLEKFLLVEEAWKVLGDTQARTLYDAKRILVNSSYGKPVDEELTLKDLEVDLEKGQHRKQCRCGGWFSVDSDEIARGGLIAIECGDCSLSLLVDCDVR